ncbi:MAG TPA: aspartyl protease family protein [Blastocatellia bacterium]|nr:aspartyl protease family protein [Blastocatellia bacterium]
MKKEVPAILPLTLRQILTFSTWILLLSGCLLLLISCSNSRPTLVTFASSSATDFAVSTPRAKNDSSSFSKNFFSAFPLVRVQIIGSDSDQAAGGKSGKEADGEVLEFLFDTGNAGLSVVDISVAQRLGLKPTPSGSISFAGVTLPTLRAKADRVQLFNHGRAERRLQLRDINFQVVDLTPFAELAGRRVDGILGYDVIRRFVTTVDYQRQTVIFGKETVIRPPAATASPSPVAGIATSDKSSTESSSGVSKQGNRIVMPFELRNGWIVVKTQINGSLQEEMILDTGASITTFTQEKARQLSFDVSSARPTTLMLPIGRLTYLPHRLREIEFGGVKLDNTASVVVSTRDGLFTAGTGMSLLGANVLRRFLLTIDYGRRQLTLERYAGFESDPHEYTSIGVLPMLRDGHFYVSGVVNGSPADDEGIEIGDEIVQLDGRAMDAYSFSELADALRGPDGSHLDITVRRGLRTIELRLKRVRLL